MRAPIFPGTLRPAISTPAGAEIFLPIHDQNPIRHIRFPTVTYGLIAANILIYILEALLTPAAFDQMTINFGMIPIVVRDIVPSPLPWMPDFATLFTYSFLHADWLHLLSNMLFLFIFGDNIEDAMGHFRFLAFYLLCGVVAALVHLGFNMDGNGPLIGASGAVAGVMGAYVVLYPHARVIVLARVIIPVPLPLPAFWMLAIWFAFQVFYLLIGSAEPVAWWAHIGGVAAGILLTLAFKRREVPLFGGR